MTNLHDILEKARSSGQRLSASEAAVLYAAIVRAAAAQGATLRARLAQIDESGALHLAPFDDQAPEGEPGYLAPELLAKDAPRKSEPRVQVYAAGALGYEILTGHQPPQPGSVPGPELAGPLGDIVRMALAPDRRERFGDLTQLYDAIEGVQPRPPAEGERNIFSALRNRYTRVAPEKEALAKLIEKLHQMEAQVAQLARSQAKLEGGQRQAMQAIEHFEDGQRRLSAPRQSAFGPALLAAVLAASAIVGVGWAMGIVPLPGRAPPQPSTPTAAPPPPPVEAAPVTPAVPDAAVKAAEESDAGSAVAAGDAGSALAALDAGAPPDAGAISAAAASRPDAGTASPPAPAKKRARGTETVSQAAMVHAVAVSQIRRGESALEQGRADEALESFRAALENEPTMAVAFRGMGMAYAMQGNDTQALQAYQRYLQLSPGAADKAEIRRSISELRARAKIGASEK